jgi:hypothetical protein
MILFWSIGRSENRGRLLVLATAFFDALAESLTFYLRQVIDEQPAFEMIHFVLHTNGE